MVECPLCDFIGNEFLPFGLVQRLNALCPVCNALERHRNAWKYFETTNLFRDNIKMLDIAPMKIVSDKLRAMSNIDYLSADLNSPNAMIQMDLTDIQFPDCTFDVIYCSHVLEHIPDDRKAMREIFRVLKPNGWALLVVPMYGNTIEDNTITDPKEREKRFGQFDHVRVYGNDGIFEYRLKETGFKVTEINPVRMFDKSEIQRFGLREEKIHYCEKINY